MVDFSLFALVFFAKLCFLYNLMLLQEYEDLDEYEEDGEEEEYEDDVEYEEEAVHEPTPEELEYLRLRQRLKESVRKQMEKELGTANCGSREYTNSFRKDKCVLFHIYVLSLFFIMSLPKNR